MSTLFTDPLQDATQRDLLSAMPPDYSALEPGLLAGIPSGLGQGVSRGLAGVYAVGADLAPYSPAGALLGHDSFAPARDFAKSWLDDSRLDPATHGGISRVLYGMTSFAPAIAGSAVNPLLGAVIAGSGSYESGFADLKHEGVSDTAARQGASAEAIFAAFGATLPAHFGQAKLANTLAFGPGAFVAQDIAARYTIAATLEANGYPELAAQYRHLDATSLIADVLIGGAFAHVGARSEAHTQARIDAALAHNDNRVRQLSGPGIPIDLPSQAQHAAALDKATADLLTDRPVDASGIEGATFLADLEGALARALNQIGYHEEAAQVAALEAEIASRGIQTPGEEPLPALTQAGRDVVNPVPLDGSPEQKPAVIHRLTAENQPVVDDFLKQLDAELGTQSKSNVKTDEAILGKASRPSILADKPWHGIEHIRDTFRFKTVVNSLADLPKVAAKIAERGWKVVKIDTTKMLAPKEWGWRFVALDLQMPNGQLVEFYMPLRELETAKAANHLLFEKWRNRDRNTLTPTERRERRADIELSRETYDAAFYAALARTGEKETALRAALASFEASAAGGLSKDASSTASVTGKGALSDQAPDLSRNALKPSGPNTATIDPVSDTYTSSASDIAATSGESIPKSTPLDKSDFHVLGKTTQVVTERGAKLNVTYAIVDASELVTSHDNALVANPDFPAELQPRDRARAASESQITKIANAINPELLVESPKAADGAPIVGQDKVVESGNARTIALRRAYAGGKADEYRAYLIANAERFGIDPAKIRGEPIDQGLLDAVLSEHGETIPNGIVAAGRWSNGDRIFAMHEQSADATEVTSFAMLESYAPDQLVALKRSVAADLGIPEPGIPHPILVRVTEGGYDRAEFARQANESTVAAMSATERARADASRMPDLANLVTNDAGLVNSSASSQFIAKFMKDVVGENELATMMTADGTLSQEGQARIRNAVFAKAYGDASLVAMMAEATDGNVKNVMAAMLRAAGPIAKLREMMGEGARDLSLDIIPDFIAAVRKFSQLRSDGLTVEQFRSQADMFGDTGLSARANDLLTVIGENSKAPKRMAEFLTRWVDMVDAVGAKPSGESIVSKAASDTARANAEPRPAADMFGAGARRIAAENPAAQISTPAGDMPAVDAMANADEAVDRAGNDAKQFAAAVGCSLRYGT